MLLSKLLCVALSIAILVQAFAVRRAVGTWIYPACLYGLFWFAFSFFPIVLVPGTYSSPYAMAYILASCLAVSLGSTMIHFGQAYRAGPSFEDRDRLVFGSRLVQLTFVGSAFSALACLIIDATIQGVSLRALVSDFFATSNSLMAARYSDDLISNIFSQLATVLNYLASFIGGMIYWAITGRGARHKRAAVILVAFVPSIFVLTVQAAKGTLFLSLALFVAGILICRARARQDLPINWATMTTGLRYSVILLPLLVVSFISRGLYEAQSIGDVAFELRRYFTSYALGHLYAFSDWFDYFFQTNNSMQYYSNEERTYGFYTFMSVFRTFGDERFVPAGIFDEYYTDGLFLSTNVYTVFRGLITDFTLVGSLIFTNFISIIVHYTFKDAVTKYDSPLSTAVFAVFCGFLATSYIISVLIWNSIYVLLVMIMLFLAFARGAHYIQQNARLR